MEDQRTLSGPKMWNISTSTFNYRKSDLQSHFHFFFIKCIVLDDSFVARRRNPHFLETHCDCHH